MLRSFNHKTPKPRPQNMIPALCLLAYLIGSIPFSIILGQSLKGLDLREHGSGNPGATNAIRILGWKIGTLVLLLDISKGIAPLAIAHSLLQNPSESTLVAIGFSAIIGHILSIFLKFKGGKGVATSAGVIACLDPLAFSLALTLFSLTLLLFRYVSLSSLLAVSSLTISSFLIQLSQNQPLQALKIHSPKLAFFSLLSAIVFARHTGNIKRLWNGTENKLGTTQNQNQCQQAKNHPPESPQPQTPESN